MWNFDFTGIPLVILLAGIAIGVISVGLVCLLIYCGVLWYGLAAMLGGVVGAAVYSTAQKLV